jgi:hypothetical protein
MKPPVFSGRPGPLDARAWQACKDAGEISASGQALGLDRVRGRAPLWRLFLRSAWDFAGSHAPALALPQGEPPQQDQRQIIDSAVAGHGEPLAARVGAADQGAPCPAANLAGGPAPPPPGKQQDPQQQQHVKVGLSALSDVTAVQRASTPAAAPVPQQAQRAPAARPQQLPQPLSQQQLAAVLKSNASALAAIAAAVAGRPPAGGGAGPGGAQLLSSIVKEEQLQEAAAAEGEPPHSKPLAAPLAMPLAMPLLPLPRVGPGGAGGAGPLLGLKANAALTQHLLATMAKQQAGLARPLAMLLPPGGLPPVSAAATAAAAAGFKPLQLAAGLPNISGASMAAAAANLFAQQQQQQQQQQHVVHLRRLPGSLRGPCAHCGTQASSQWRSGPPDKPCLCNACGLFWSKRRSLPEETCKVADELKVGKGWCFVLFRV